MNTTLPIAALDAFGPRTWADPGAISLARLAMRSPLVAHPSSEATCGRRETSPWWRSLDGRWQFRLRDRPTDVVPDDVSGPTTTDVGWSNLHVPGHWTTQGFDVPHYTNVQMPFPGRPPELPDANPAGVY